MSTEPTTSIIIPAHNEEKVIAFTLAALLPGIDDRSLEVIVVCNGCNDRTAEIAAAQHPSIVVLETPIASKANALNLGDQAANWYPRIYLDADVTLSIDSIEKLKMALNGGIFLVGSPVLKMEFNQASWAVRSYYAIWQRLPYVQEGLIGTGVYALSKKGRQRFDLFPDIIADDGYIRALFCQNERISLTNCYSLVRAPQNLSGLMTIKARSRRGRYQLAREFPELLKNERKNYGKALLPLLRRISLWPELAIYVYVNLVSRVLARSHDRKMSNSVIWERDETSRNTAVGTKQNE